MAFRDPPEDAEIGAAQPTEAPSWTSISKLSAIKAVLVPASVRQNPKPSISSAAARSVLMPEGCVSALNPKPVT